MESIVNKKAKIRWMCRRGMLELDILLNRFYDKMIDHLPTNQMALFESLLNHPDPDLYAWLMGYEKPLPEVADVVALIQFHDQT